MSPRTRPRVPHFFGFLQIILRIGALGTALAAIVMLGRLASKYSYANNGRGKTFGGAITASIIAFIVNLYECITLADPTHRIKRPITCIIVTSDIVVFALAMYSIFEIMLNESSLEDALDDGSPPWTNLQFVAFALMCAIVAESFTALLLDYVGVFRQVRVSSKDRRSARAVVSQLRSPEQPVQTSAG